MVWVCYQIHIPIGFKTVDYYFGDWAVYKKWLIFALYHQNSYSSILLDRLCGIFNEPGALGTICALLFIITFEKTKLWEKILLLLTGLLTYSVAFFVLTFGFLIVYLCVKDSRYIVLAIGLVILFLKIPTIDWKNDALNGLASRLIISGNGLSGNNRLTDSYKASYEAMKKTSYILCGYGKGFDFSEGSLSYVKYIVQFGYIGFGIMMIQWLGMTVVNIKSKMQYVYVLFFFASLYQRPAPIISILGYVLVFGGLSWMQREEQIRKIKGKWYD